MAFLPRKKHVRRDSGFTLIEMLVVILIIIVLMGIVFRLAHVSTGAGANSDTMARIEAMKAALEEFYAEYGMYPPVPENSGSQSMTFSYPAKLPADIAAAQSGYFTWGLLSFLKNRAEVIYDGASKEVRENAALYKDKTAWADGDNRILSNGLRSEEDVKSCTTERDRIFLNRIDPFLKKAKVFSDTARQKDNKNVWITTWHVWDGWNRDLVYISKPPYQSYALFSKGPDGEYSKNDPLNREEPKNKDNVYGNAGENN